LAAIGLIWFVFAQRRPERSYTVLPPGASDEVSPDAAAAVAADAAPDEESGEAVVGPEVAGVDDSEAATDSDEGEEEQPADVSSAAAAEADAKTSRSEN
jgi:hypothetical protein